MRSWHKSVAASGLVLLALTAVACTTGGTAAPTTGATSPTVSEAWVRPPQGMDRPAAGYMIITGGSSADALLSVSTTAAGMVEIHETTVDASGMAGMHPIPRLDVPAGGRVELRPGGYHLMLMQVVEGAIEVGKTVELRLTFEKAGEIVVQAEVLAG
ncbi:MAG: copper chaperone PCu(A)C [Anaerolineales bacterium]|nr:copper chaperone PCu(A)C [Anaerolineales bacterium]